MDSVTGASPRQLARTAGGLYLVNIVFGAFAIGIVPAMLIGPDLAVTAHNIETHQMLYRLSLAAHLVVTLTNVPLAMIFYDLFKVVSRRLALLDVFFTLIATAIEAAGLYGQFTSLVLLDGKSYAGALPPAQLQALAHLPADLAPVNYSVYGVFYGFDILCVAYLVFKSTFLPRLIGVLLAVDGLAYLVSGFTSMLAPGVAAHLSPWIDLPAPVGEGSLCLWLLVAGVNVRRWRERAGTAIPAASAQLGAEM